jgi:hypothetical protein
MLDGRPPCRQCRAIHGNVTHLIAADIICPRCRVRLTKGGGHGVAPCSATTKAFALCARGMHSVRRWRTAGNAEWLTSPSRHAAEILHMFDLPATLARTLYTGGGPVSVECWTSREGIDLLIMVQAVARNYLSISNPAAARLLKAYPDALAEFRALWNLDGDDRALQAVLEPLNADVSAAVANRLAVVPTLRKRKPCR